MGRGEQIEHGFDYPKHGESRISRKKDKKLKLRRERRRAKRDPECPSEYRKYSGYEY